MAFAHDQPERKFEKSGEHNIYEAVLHELEHETTWLT
jgi:hypothetical protein